MYTIESLTGSPTLILRVLNGVERVSTLLESRGDVEIGILVLLECRMSLEKGQDAQIKVGMQILGGLSN